MTIPISTLQIILGLVIMAIATVDLIYIHNVSCSQKEILMTLKQVQFNTEELELKLDFIERPNVVSPTTQQIKVSVDIERIKDRTDGLTRALADTEKMIGKPQTRPTESK